MKHSHYTTEQWRPIAEAPSYAVSNFGRVARVRGGQGARPLIRKLDLEDTGYYRVRLSEAGLRLRLSVHRLVAKAFLGEPPTEKHQVAHYDNNKLNNHVENLRWATCAENIRDKQRHGTQPRGATNGRAKLTERDVLAVRASDKSPQKLAAEYDVSVATIYRIKNRSSWRHI